MTAKPLIIETFHGLANRLMAVLSGLRLARRFDRPFGVCWPVDEHLAAAFDTLFDLRLPQFQPGSYRGAMGYLDIDWATGRFLMPPRVSNVEPESALWIRSHAILAHDAEPRADAFATYDPVVFEMARYFALLRPSRPVRDIVEQWAHIPFERTVAVHIRRPNPRDRGEAHRLDQLVRWDFPTDEGYARLIELMMRARDDLLFYVATNSPETEDWLKQRFGERLIVRPRLSVDRSLDERAIIEAMADMILIARCAMCLRYVSSTFPYLASVIGQNDSIVVGRPRGAEPERLMYVSFQANATVLKAGINDLSGLMRRLPIVPG